jgi:hypothetical protein
MIYSLHALIVRRGNLVRSDIARPDTIARYLATVSPLADYQVFYWLDHQSHRVTGEGFLALYEAGRIPQRPTLKEMQEVSR